MKILSFQPYSLYAAGGGSRILRRLYEGREYNIRSMVVTAYPSTYSGPIAETTVYARPTQRRWMRFVLRNWAIWLRSKVFRKATERSLFRRALKEDFDVLHIVNHGDFSALLCTDALLENRRLWVSFHDHFKSIGSSAQHARLLWEKANRRLVISAELGDEYNKLFGKKDYQIITDGVAQNEVTYRALASNDGAIVVYFAGLLHIDYIPLFQVLAAALDVLAEMGKKITLVLRGTQKLDFLANRKFIVDYKPLIIDNQVLKQELDSATILYLPMKFTDPEFYKYSLSTKMVGYLGAPGVILYHGPGESAACRLLERNEASLICTNLEISSLASTIHQCTSDWERLATNAKKLALQQFDIEKIRSLFWTS